MEKALTSSFSFWKVPASSKVVIAASYMEKALVGTLGILSISNILKHHSHVWDREKILHPATVESLLHKYNVPLSPCVDPLLDRFEHEELPGLVNYETMLQWLHTQRQLGQVSQAPDPGQYCSL